MLNLQMWIDVRRLQALNKIKAHPTRKNLALRGRIEVLDELEALLLSQETKNEIMAPLGDGNENPDKQDS